MKSAIGSGVAGIIVDHGTSPTLCPLINQATDAGIAVVVYDVKVAECAPKAVETAQNDVGLASLVLTQMAKDIGDAAPVGYVNPMVIAPLERRDVVWKQFVAEHKWSQKFSAALKKHPEVKAVFAPYDEVTKGAVTAIEENKLGTRVAAYGIDISDADIELMTKKDSPWKATATTDPSAIGAGVTRAMALQIAGQLHDKQVIFPGVLVTQAFLLQEQIKNMGDLRAKLPDLSLASTASAPWLRSVTF
jgi:simple sugar transport system substrate-binding protein